MPLHPKYIARDISWLSFNARVLQEAGDMKNTLADRIKFLSIFSNNLDEFFRVRVATLKRMAAVPKSKDNQNRLAKNVLTEIDEIVKNQQITFNTTWENVKQNLAVQNIFFKTAQNLSAVQQNFLWHYFDTEIESNITPLMLDPIRDFPQLREKSLYLAVTLHGARLKKNTKYALIEVPVRYTSRFIKLPSTDNSTNIILLEDAIRFALPRIFSFFNVTHFEGSIIKFTRDAELDLDNDITNDLIKNLEKGLKERKKARAVQFTYDADLNKNYLTHLLQKLGISKSDSVTPSNMIQNFRHFSDLPKLLQLPSKAAFTPFHHPLLENSRTVSSVVMKRDVLLHFPYHSFDAIIDLLREAAIDPEVKEIKITAYRLAENSKIINTLINAKKNGKLITVVLELKARFDEEANLLWKTRLEEEGITVNIGVPNKKVHAKICLIKKVTKGITTHYGFISTGNINEQTAKLYSDTCLLTSDRFLMADVNRIFKYLTSANHDEKILASCKKLLVSPINMRSVNLQHISAAKKFHSNKQKSEIIIKLNSLTDFSLIEALTDAKKKEVDTQLIIRSIFCSPTSGSKLDAISIVDNLLEHSRIFCYAYNNKKHVYLSSADWMSRNLDHRIEAAVPITELDMQDELYTFLQLQLSDNTKARIFDASLENKYKTNDGKILSAQQSFYLFLKQKKYK